VGWEDGCGLVVPTGARATDVAHVQLAPDPRSASLARRFVAEQVAGLDEDGRDTALLLTSELATNVVLHARTPMVVSVHRGQGFVAVAVYDEDLGRSETGGEDRHGGRGLGIVSALSCGSGRQSHPGGGKTSWFRLCLDADHASHASEGQLPA